MNINSVSPEPKGKMISIPYDMGPCWYFYRIFEDLFTIKGEFDMEKEYVCIVCGYIYDSEVGDPTTQVKPGTSFDNLPSTWICPVCGASKDMFEPKDNNMNHFFD